MPAVVHQRAPPEARVPSQPSSGNDPHDVVRERYSPASWRTIDQDLSDSRFERVNLAGSHFQLAQLGGVEFRFCELEGTQFRIVEMYGVKMRGVELRDVEISGEIGNLKVNGVEVGPLVEAQLDGRYPFGPVSLRL